MKKRQIIPDYKKLCVSQWDENDCCYTVDGNGRTVCNGLGCTRLRLVQPSSVTHLASLAVNPCSNHSLSSLVKQIAIA